MSFLNRAARGALCIVFAAALAAWGNSEADQRKAFIAFLQDINNRPGIHFLVPIDKLVAAQRQSDRVLGGISPILTAAALPTPKSMELAIESYAENVIPSGIVIRNVCLLIGSGERFVTAQRQSGRVFGGN